ncbi:MAG TPA: cation:proton antiporter, partial [Pyrinomonadaceae bacterium]|nr:cation:proton antiporter [Pyrinomonadaceae bacterium]
MPACGLVLLFARNVWAGTQDKPSNSLDPLVLLGIAVILIAAKLCGELFERIGQPAVLGEIIAGIILGNLVLIGFTAAEPLKSDPIISALAEIGVIIL